MTWRGPMSTILTTATELIVGDIPRASALQVWSWQSM
jgi:hypothetical protein